MSTDRKSTRLNSSHTVIYTLSLHDALPIFPGVQRRYPNTRMGVEEVIRDAFTRARDYKKTWDEYRSASSRGERNLIPPRRDLQLEPLVEVLEGKRYVHAHCYRAD